MTGRRLKRFVATPDVLALRITPRDIEILRHVARHRFLSSRQVATLVGDRGRVPRRLQALFHNGYLDRPRAQLTYYGTAGSERLIYGLGDKGAKLLAETDGETSGRLRWTQKNREAKQLFIKHTVAVAEVLIALEQACTPATGLRFVGEDELLEHAPEATRAMKAPTKVSARVTYKGKSYDLAQVPDAVFSLVETEGVNRRQYNFLLELDTGSMPVVRKAASLTTENRQTSLLSKVLTYAKAHADRQMRERLGWSSFRVLIVTTAARGQGIETSLPDDTGLRRLVQVETIATVTRLVAALAKIESSISAAAASAAIDQV